MHALTRTLTLFPALCLTLILATTSAIAAPAATTPPPPPPTTATPPPTAAAPSPTAGWALRFTPALNVRLRAAGCRFDPTDRYMAGRFAKRGFSAVQFVQAYMALRTHARGDRKYLEALATFHLLGLPWKHWAAYHRSGGKLSRFYNRELIGGNGMFLAGWIVFGVVGAPGLVFGSIMLGKGMAQGGLGGGIGAVFGMGLLAVGVIGSAIGLPLGIIGLFKKRKWVKGDLFDTGTVDQLIDYKLKRLQRTSLDRFKLRLAPVVTRGGGGLALGLTF